MGIKKLEITLTELEDMIKKEWAADDSVTIMISSAPGIGKTSILEEIAKAQGFRFATMRAALYEAVEINGYPMPKDGKVTYYAPPFVPGPEEKFLLIFDELNRGRKDFIQASFRVMEQRGTDSWDFKPKYHKVVVLVNPIADNDDVEPLGDALINRGVMFYIKPDIKAFLKWAHRSNIDNRVIQFLAEHEEFLHVLPAEDDKGMDVAWTSPRSWELVSRLLQRHDTAIMEQIITGALGFTVGARFIKDIKDPDKPVSAITILGDKYDKTQQDKFARHQDKKSPHKAFATVLDLTSKLNTLELSAIDLPALKKFYDTIELQEVQSAFIKGIEQDEKEHRFDALTKGLKIGADIMKIAKDFQDTKKKLKK